MVDEREQAIALADAVVEMTPHGEAIRYDAAVDIGCECEACQLSSSCKCRACTKVFGASKAHIGNGYETD